MIPYEKNPQQFLGIVAAGVALLATAYVVWDLLEVAGGHGENPDFGGEGDPNRSNRKPYVLTLDHQWQAVDEDYAVPPGAEIRMDLSTGISYARLPKEELGGLGPF